MDFFKALTGTVTGSIPEQDAEPSFIEPEQWHPDPNRPAKENPVDPANQLADVLERLGVVLDTLTPGIPGIEGAEQWPEFVHDAFTVDTTLYTVPANRRRTSVLFHNLGPDTLYVVPAQAFSTAQGMPIPVGAEREVQTPAPIRLMSDGTSSVRSLEENN